MEEAGSGEISDKELRKRVIYSLLKSSVKLARVFGVPLKELVSWLETAYFHEIRSTGVTLKETSDLLGVSQRTTVRLSKQLRESFFLPEIVHSIPRQIEFMLWSRPMGIARIKQVLPNLEAKDIEEAVAELLRTGRIKERHGRTLMYEAVSNVRRLPRDNWMAQIGGLNSFVDTLTNATYGRFFKKEQRAFARTASFPVPRGQVELLGKLYEDVILPRLTEISKDGEQCEDGEPMQLSLAWAPYDYLNTDKTDDKSEE